MKRTFLLLTTLATLAWSCPSASGALSYWDANGTDPGAGDLFGEADGDWGLNPFWGSSDGTATPGAWTDNDTAVFSAGTDAIFDSEIGLVSDITAPIYAAGLIFEEGTVTLGTPTYPGAIELTGAGGPVYVGPPTTEKTAARIGGVLAGTNGLTKTGSGTLFFVGTATPTYTGNPTNIGGVDFAIGTVIESGAVSVGDGGAGLGVIDRTINHAIILANNAALIFNRSDTMPTFSGLITGNGSVVKDGAGNFKFGSGALPAPAVFPDDSYTGDTIINAGRLTVAGTNGHAIPTGPGKGNVIINTNGVLDIGSKSSQYPGPFNIAVNGLFGYGAVTNATADQTNVLMVGNADVSSTFHGIIRKAGGNKNNHVILTKIGTGTLTLTGPNDYMAGPTTVMAGTLLANTPTRTGERSSTGNSPVIVNAGATLGGIGIINGPVTIEAGGTLSPGGSVGTLSLSNSLTLSGNLFIEVNKSLSPSNDIVKVAAVLTNAGTGTVTVTNIGPTALAAGDVFYLFQDAGGNSKPLLNGAALTIVSAGDEVWTNKLEVDGSIAVLSVGGAPEPVPATNVTLAVVGPDSVSLGGWGAANQPYEVYASTNVTLPMSSWWLLGITNSDAGGAIQFLDSQATNAQRFYRFGQTP